MRIPRRSRSVVSWIRFGSEPNGCAPLNTTELIAELNPLLRGWGEFYKRAHVRKLFQRLDGWIRRRIWSHRYRRWRKAGWKRLPAAQLYGEYELVRLIYLIPSLASWRR
jgi:RNA-directed DNA polymerase